MKKFIYLLGFVLISTSLFSQNNFWEAISNKGIEWDERTVEPKQYESFVLDLDQLKESLKDAPLFDYSVRAISPVNMRFPIGGKEMENFQVFEISNFAPALAARYPDIKSYKAISKKGSVVRFDISQFGFRGIINVVGQRTHIIEPMNQSANQYMLFSKADFELPEDAG
ncbi:MAG: hypothetical protein AAGK97_10910, partial [Bacteroidota bacterium]